MRPEQTDCLYNAIVRRLRAANTMFAQNVKLVLRQLSDDQWSLLKLPYLLVVPTVTRLRPLRPQDQPFDSIVNPHSVTFLAQLDGRGSEADWLAACDIEFAEKELISALVNWRPGIMYKPTAYAGMRIEATRAPAVKVSFVFTFFEELFLSDDSDEWLAQQAVTQGTSAELHQVIMARLRNQPPIAQDPCEAAQPCWPFPVWTADNQAGDADSESDG